MSRSHNSPGVFMIRDDTVRAALRNQPAVAKMLMKANADASLAIKKTGTTPRVIAEKNGYQDIVDILALLG